MSGRGKPNPYQPIFYRKIGKDTRGLRKNYRFCYNALIIFPHRKKIVQNAVWQSGSFRDIFSMMRVSSFQTHFGQSYRPPANRARSDEFYQRIGENGTRMSITP